MSCSSYSREGEPLEVIYKASQLPCIRHRCMLYLSGAGYGTTARAADECETLQGYMCRIKYFVETTEDLMRLA